MKTTQGLAPAEATKVAELSQVVDESIVSRIIMKNGAGNVTFFAFSAGQELSKHSAPFDALVHLIEGQAIITIDEIEHTVEAGEMIVMPANIPHAVRADQDFKMILIMLKEA